VSPPLTRARHPPFFLDLGRTFYLEVFPPPPESELSSFSNIESLSRRVRLQMQSILACSVRDLSLQLAALDSCRQVNQFITGSEEALLRFLCSCPPAVADMDFDPFGRSPRPFLRQVSPSSQHRNYSSIVGSLRPFPETVVSGF